MLALLLLCSPTSALQDLHGHYRFEDGVPGQVATGIGTLTDSGPLAAHGTPHGDPLYIADAPGWCASNGVAIELDGADDWLEFDSTFVFHAPFGDATLEFSAKVPEPGVHRDLLWTTLSSDQESPNRFHLNLNPGGELWFDYRDEAGSLQLIVSPGDGVYLDLDVWNHMVIVRSVGQDGSHDYRVFKNGALVHSFLDQDPSLPTAAGWTIAGRPGPYPRAQGILDEVRMHTRALEPYEFQFAELVQPYCGPASPNSVDPLGARLSAVGCPSLGANQFGVAAEGLPPGVIGVLAVGQQQAQIPFGNGVLCVGGTVQRVGPAFADALGQLSIPIDLDGPLSVGNGVEPGDQRFLQLWYRDPAAPPAGFNLSDALAVTFAP